MNFNLPFCVLIRTGKNCVLCEAQSSCPFGFQLFFCMTLNKHCLIWFWSFQKEMAFLERCKGTRVATFLSAGQEVTDSLEIFEWPSWIFHNAAAVLVPFRVIHASSTLLCKYQKGGGVRVVLQQDLSLPWGARVRRERELFFHSAEIQPPDNGRCKPLSLSLLSRNTRSTTVKNWNWTENCGHFLQISTCCTKATTFVRTSLGTGAQGVSIRRTYTCTQGE